MNKVTRVSAINMRKEGGLKKTDFNCMIKSLRLAWIKRIFDKNNGTWKSCLQHLLDPIGGFIFLNCNNDIKDYNISSQFYCEILSRWSDFRDYFTSQRDWQNIIWNNNEICIEDKRPIFYKNYFEAGVICIQDLLFHLNINEAFSHWSDMITNIRYLSFFSSSFLLN